MTELVETIAKALVDDPSQVVVTGGSDASGEVLRLQVAESDMGKVIGKKGRIAKALRTVVKAAAAKQNKNVSVEIVSGDEAGAEPAAETEPEEPASAEEE